MPSSHLILCRPLLLLPQKPPSIRIFSNESTLHMSWPKYWSFSFSISSSNEHPGLISFRMHWLDQSPCSPGDSQESSPTLQFKSFNSLVLSFLHSSTLTSIHDHWKNHSLDITFLPRSKRFLISWLQSPSTVILEPKKIKSDTVSTVSPSICHEVMGLDAMIFVF